MQRRYNSPTSDRVVDNCNNAHYLSKCKGLTQWTPLIKKQNSNGMNWVQLCTLAFKVHDWGHYNWPSLLFKYKGLMEWAVPAGREKKDGRGQAKVEGFPCLIHGNSNKHKCPHNRPRIGALAISNPVVLQRGLRVGSYSNGMNYVQLHMLVFKVHDSGHYNYAP